VSGLELCPKCKKGYLYPVVTARVREEPKGQYSEASSIRDYQCDICGHKQNPRKKTQTVDVKDNLSIRVIKAKKAKTTPKPKAKKAKTTPKPKAKKTKTTPKPKAKKTKSRK
jgi:hypothetical protein